MLVITLPLQDLNLKVILVEEIPRSGRNVSRVQRRRRWADGATDGNHTDVYTLRLVYIRQGLHHVSLRGLDHGEDEEIRDRILGQQGARDEEGRPCLRVGALEVGELGERPLGGGI